MPPPALLVLQYSKEVTGPEWVQYVSTTEVRCRQPHFPAPFPSPSYLEVSVDGQKYSTSGVQYDVVGPRTAIKADPEVRAFHIPNTPSIDLRFRRHTPASLTNL